MAAGFYLNKKRNNKIMFIASSLVTPNIGLIFWTTLVFLILLVLLRAFAWKPILKAVKDREDNINDALQSAEKAKKEMAKLQSDHEALVRKAKNERNEILKEAKETKDKVIGEAQAIAKEEASKIMANAKSEIEKNKEKAFKELKNEVANIAVDVATKILRSELTDKAKSEKLVEEYLKEAKLN